MVGLEPCFVKLDQILAGELRDAGLGAGTGERIAIGMLRAVQQAWEDAQAHGLGADFLALNGGDLLLLLPAEIGFREGRMQDHIGVQFERRVQVAFQRGE